MALALEKFCQAAGVAPVCRGAAAVAGQDGRVCDAASGAGLRAAVRRWRMVAGRRVQGALLMKGKVHRLG